MAGPGGTSVGRVSIKVLPDTSDFSKELGAYIKRIESSLKVELPTSLDLTGFKDDLRKLEIEAKAASPEVKVKTDIDKSQTREIENVVGKLGILQKAAGLVGDAFDGIGSSVSSAASGVGGLVSKIPILPVALAAAAPLAADLAVSLGPGLVVGLSAVTGVGVAVGVLALGMGKLQKAFKPVLDGFQQMRNRIGDVLASGVRPLVAEFVGRAMPVLQAGLSSIARTLNGVVKDLLRWASSSDTLMLLGDLFHGLNEAMQPLRTAVVAVIDAIVRLATAGTPALEQISTVVAQLAVRFDNFVKAGERSGSLPKLINDSVAAAGRLLTAVGRLGLALFNTFAAVGKGSTGGLTEAISAIADAVDRFNASGGGAKIHDFLVKVGQAIGQYFASGEFARTVADFRTMAQNVNATIGPMRDLVGWVQGLVAGFRSVPGGGGLLDSIAGALSPLLTAMQSIKALQTLIPATWARVTSATSTAWAAVTGFVTSAWATITSTISGAASAAVAALVSAWGSVTGFFSSLWASITSGVSTAWATVTSAVSTATSAVMGVITAFVGAVAAVWNGFWGSSFGQLVIAQINLVQAVINLLGAVVTAVFGAMVAFVTMSVQGIIGAVVNAWNLISAVTSTAWGAVSGVVSAAWGAISGYVSQGASAAWGYVSAAWSAITGFTSRAWAAVSSTISGWWSTISGTTNAAGSSILSTVTGWFSRVGSFIGQAFQSGYNGAVTWLGNLLSSVAGFGSRILDTVSGWGSMLFNAGSKLIQGLIDGITFRIKDVTDAVNGIANKIKGFFPGSPVKEGPLTSWNNGGAGKRLVTMLVTGLSDTSSLDAAMQSLAGKVATPLTASALAPSAAGGGSVAAGGVNVYVTNPVPETASESTTRIMRRLALLGPAALPATA